MRLHEARRPPWVFFTEVSLVALRTMMAQPRLADPAKFARICQELGIDTSLIGDAAA